MYNFPLAFLFEICHRSNTLVVVFPGTVQCQDSLDCARMNLGGYTCQNSRCVCDPNTDTGLFPCRGNNTVLTAFWTSVDTRRCNVLSVTLFVLTDVVTVRHSRWTGLATVLWLNGVTEKFTGRCVLP